MDLRPIDTSKPRDDLASDPLALEWKPRQGAASLQQYLGTNVVQWHVRRGASWEPSGPVMRIEQRVDGIIL